MSKDMDLDAILSEFKDYQGVSASVSSAQSKRPAARPAAPRSEQPQPQEPAPQPCREQSAPQSGQPAPRAVRRAREEAPRSGAEFGAALQKMGEGIRQAPEKREKSNWTPPRWLLALVSLGLLALICLCMSWMLHNVHPTSSGIKVVDAPKLNLAALMDRRGSAGGSGSGSAADPADPDSQSVDPLAEPLKVHYVIEEGAVVAPAPNPACFGNISIDHPEEVLEVIQKARDYGLLGEDETVAFDPNVTFYYDEDIEYYLDETILVICWKEVIDGNTCSFVEIKVADASQFRRKFADDAYASRNQYYSTVMHKSTNAVVTLNADFYQNRDFGVVVYDRTLYRFPTETYTGSYKKYNCLETCFVDSNGDFLFTELGQIFTKESLEQYIRDNDILFSLSFGPVLVQDGQVRQCNWYPVGEIERGYSRAGIGQVDKLHYLYMSLNHSPEKQARWTVNEFARHFGEKPVINAYCLDGGQTGEIVFQGRAYNHVDFVNGQSERVVSDNIYFATAIGGTEVYQ